MLSKKTADQAFIQMEELKVKIKSSSCRWKKKVFVSSNNEESCDE